MSYERTVPSSAHELFTYLKKICDNRSHVKKVVVNPTNAHLEVQLDFGAHVAGNPDVYLPLKRSKITDATVFVEKMLKQADMGFSPSESQAQELYDMLDPSQR